MHAPKTRCWCSSVPRYHTAIARPCLLGAALALTGCAGTSVTNETGLSASTETSVLSIERSICVDRVTVGDTAHLFSEVDDDRFLDLLEESLSTKTLMPRFYGTCRYDLRSEIESIAWSSIAVVVMASVEYTVIDRATGELFFETAVSNVFVPVYPYSTSGLNFGNLAQMGVMQANIDTFIDELLTEASRDPAEPPTTPGS